MVAEAKRGSWPQDDNLWQIQCFGELDTAEGTPSELSQHLLLRYVPERGRIAPSQLTKIVHAGSGLIPSLTIGQRYRNQRLVGVARYQEIEAELDFGPRHWHWVDGSSTFGNNKYLIPPRVYPLAPLSRVPFLAFTYKDVPEGLLIPCSEITRTWFFRSTALIHRFTEEPLTREGLDRFCRLENSGDAGGAWRVEGRTGLSESDLFVVGMLLCDPLAFERAQLLMDSLVEARNRGAPYYIRSLPPLDGRWKLRVQGQWFTSGNANRFLVHRIITAPFPRNPGHLHGDLENSNNAVDLGRVELKETKWNKKPSRHATGKDRAMNEREPEAGGGEVYEFGALPSLYNMPFFEKFAPREQTTRNTGNANKEPPKEGDASTGQGNYAEGNPNPMKVKDDQPIRRAIPPHGFANLMALSQKLNELPHMSSRSVARSREIAGSLEAPRCLFPLKRRKKQWAMVDLRPRQFMVLEITVCEKLVYAVEIERRPDPPKPKKGEHFALGLLMARDGKELGRGRFEDIIDELIERHGVWSYEPEDLLVQKADHRSTDVAGFAALVASKIYEWVPDARPPKAPKQRKRKKTESEAA